MYPTILKYMYMCIVEYGKKTATKAMSMDDHRTEYMACRSLLQREEIKPVVEWLRKLDYGDRLAVLKKVCGYPDSLLVQIITTINKSGHKRETDNPVKLILYQVLPADRLDVLIVGYDHRYTCQTPLGAACSHDDFETIQHIVESVADESERFELLSNSSTVLQRSVLLDAAKWVTARTMNYLLNCLPVKHVIHFLSVSGQSPVTAAISSRRFSVAWILLSFFVENCSDYETGN